AHQHEGLGGGGVGLHLRAPVHEDQGLADGLEDVVPHHEQEQVQHHQQRVGALAVALIAEDAQEAVDGVRLRRYVGGGGGGGHAGMGAVSAVDRLSASGVSHP